MVPKFERRRLTGTCVKAPNEIFTQHGAVLEKSELASPADVLRGLSRVSGAGTRPASL